MKRLITFLFLVGIAPLLDAQPINNISDCTTQETQMRTIPSNWALYIGQGCPFCKKVTDVIASNNLSITIKDTWKDQEAAKELFEATGRKTVPCLRMGDQWMHESSDIIAKLTA